MKILRKRKQITTALAFSPVKDLLITTALAFSPVKDLLAVAGEADPKQSRIDIWDIPNGDKPIMLPMLQYPVDNMMFTPDGKLLVDDMDRVILYSGPRFEITEVIPYLVRLPFVSAAFSLDGQYMVLDETTHTRLIQLEPPFLEIWNQPVTYFRSAPGGVAFSPDGRRFAVSGFRTVEIRLQGNRQ